MVQAAGRAAGAFAADGGDTATPGGDTQGSGKLAWPIAPGARPPARATTPLAALSAAEASLDTALARIDDSVRLLDALGDIAESYFETIVASGAAGVSPDVARAAAFEHALQVLQLVAAEAPPWFGAGPGSLDIAELDGIASTASSRLVQGLIGPLTADAREMAAAERKAVDDIAHATYGLTQARARLSATQQRIARASASVRSERRDIETGSLGMCSVTFATLAAVLRTRSAAVTGGSAGADARPAGRPQRA